MMFDVPYGTGGPTRLGQKLMSINWGLVFFLTLIASVGFMMLISAEGGSFEPYASAQMKRFAVGFAVLIFVAVIDVRVWMSLAFPAYGVALLLLIAVEIMGFVGKGAQRWLDLGPVNLQPSELMKIALTLALARYYHMITADQVSRPLYLLGPLLLIAVPTALVLRQPDLGTGVMLAAGGAGIVFLAGLQWRYILGAAIAVAAAVPVAWDHFLLDYQRQRVLTLLNPEADPLGAGYHITQAKIALGSGGVWGKGFMQGTQSHLDFLPEQQTDFIFTMLAEEFGLVGALGLLALYFIVLAYAVVIAMTSRNHFGRLLAMGVALTFLFYVVINVAMVTGVIPVVGVPLPLVSYGGTSMMTLLFGFGLIMSVHVHRHMEVPRRPGSFW